MFPNAKFLKRGKKSIEKVIEIANRRHCTDLVVINEDHKELSMFPHQKRHSFEK